MADSFCEQAEAETVLALSRMHLINVEAVLNIMDEQTPIDSLATKVLERFRVYEESSLEYAILSHCWQDNEVGFEAMSNLTKDALQTHSGEKVVRSCIEARKQGLKWLWIDSCCIDERERQRAINSMYRWYRWSKICYAYLHDVTDAFPGEASSQTKWPRWFFRGWTLQELIAPVKLKFFNQNWEEIGDRTSLASTLNTITRISTTILEANGPGPVPRTLTDHFGVAQIMSWAADRETSEPEDKAYSLVGLFGVSLTVIYGEGASYAFQRLQDVLVKEYGDQSIFSWSGESKSGSVLADSPSDFRNCADVIKRDFHSSAQSRRQPIQICQGIVKVQLQVTRCRASSYIFQAELACCHRGNAQPITITLAEVNEVYHRISGDFPLSNETEERDIELCCHPVDPSFVFDISNLPRTIDLGGNFLRRDSEDQALHLTNIQHQVISYHRVASSTSGTDPASTFAITFGLCLGRDSVHVECDGPSGEITSDVLHHANCIHHSRREIARHTASEESDVKLVKHSHIPRTFQAVELVYEIKGWKVGFVTLKVVRCVGCCMPAWMSVDGDPLNDETAKCFRQIRQSYFGFGCGTGVSSTPAQEPSEVDPCRKAIVKSFLTNVLSEECASTKNNILSPAERELITHFFVRIKAGRRCEVDILVYESLGIPLIPVISKVEDKLTKDPTEAVLQSTLECICMLRQEIQQLSKDVWPALSQDTELERVLEEDIVGRILLLCWSGICHGASGHTELDRNEKSDEDSASRNSVSYIFRKAFMETNADSRISLAGSCPLKRIMGDARKGIFKYKMLADERANR